MCDEGSRGLEAFSFEGTRARSRNKDDKNVPDATTSFKTVACLNVTLAYAKMVRSSFGGWQLRRLSSLCEL